MRGGAPCGPVLAPVLAAESDAVVALILPDGDAVGALAEEMPDSAPSPEGKASVDQLGTGRL